MTRARFPFPPLLLLLLLALAAPPACDDPKVVGSCGDDFVDPGEDCDGAELDGATCTSLGHYNALGALRCNADCTFDVSSCGGRCGDDLIEGSHNEQCEGTNLNGASCASLNFSRGGTLSCGADCQYDMTQCLSTCGDGNREPDEGCDDANSQSGDGCAPDCTVEPGWTCTTDTQSVCTPICPEGLFWCGEGDCADLFNDPTRCGACDAPCETGLRCVAGACREPGEPWSPAGIFSTSNPASPGEALGFDLGTCDGNMVLLLRHEVYSEPEDVMVGAFKVYWLDPTLGYWSLQPELVPELMENYQLTPGQAVTCRDGQITVAYSTMYGVGPAPGILVRVLDPLSIVWRRLSATELTTTCWQTNWIDIMHDAEGNLHVLDMCYWYANHAVEYAWHDGGQWKTVPSIDTLPRLVAHPGVARQSLGIVEGRAVLGIGAYDAESSTTEHRAQRWDTDSWTRSEVLDLDTAPGGGDEDISVAGNGLAICAAWVEDRDSSGEDDPRIFVRCADSLAGTWLPTGDAALATPDHQGRAPALVVAGRYLYLAYLALETEDQVDHYWHVRVLRRPIDDATAWEVVGTDFFGDYYEDNAQAPQLLLAKNRLVMGYFVNDYEPEFQNDPSILHILTP